MKVEYQNRSKLNNEPVPDLSDISEYDGPKQKQKKPKKKRRIRRYILSALLIVFLTAFTILFFRFYNAYGKTLLSCLHEAKKIAARVTESDFKASRTTLIYYSDGTLMSELKAEKNCYYLDYADIPKPAVRAFIALEDHKFFDHKGYDKAAILRAAKAYLENNGEIRQGGSTITQQLARTVFLTGEKTVSRKATEIFLAAELEKQYSKEKILEFYINNIYFAGGYYGLQAAAIGYFGRPVNELSLSEIAYLCGIPNSPSNYDPRVNPENVLTRRDSVLSQMKDMGYISLTEYNEALSADIVLDNKAAAEKHNYDETYSWYCAIRALMARDGFSFRNSFGSEDDRKLYETEYYDSYYRHYRSLYTKGYRIYTSITPGLQEMLQDAVDTELSEYTETYGEYDTYSLQGAAVCIDNDTGLVAAIVGGRSQDINGYTLNRAYQSPRQPGSAIKPLIVYTPAFEKGYYPDTMVMDEKFEGGPVNSGNVYSGEIDIRRAVSVSKNTVAWKIFEELTPKCGLSYLLRMGFEHIVDRDYVPAASLGGLTYGATAVEMTSAYATLANDGFFRSPGCISRITDADGTLIIDNTDEGAKKAGISTLPGGAYCSVSGIRVYNQNAARMMTDVLTTVMEEGTGRRFKLSTTACAGKTGTTRDQKDGWFVGFTDYYTTGVYVGCDYPKTMEELKGNTFPAYIWYSFMSRLHENAEYRAFAGYTDKRPKPTSDPYEEEPDEEAEEADEMTEDGTDGEKDDAASEETAEIPGLTENENAAGEPPYDTDENNSDSENGEDTEITPNDGIIWITPDVSDGFW